MGFGLAEYEGLLDYKSDKNRPLKGFRAVRFKASAGEV